MKKNGKRWNNMEKDYQLLFLRIKKYFRETMQTSWGKYQILDKLDDLEEEFLLDCMEEEMERKLERGSYD